MHIKKNAEIALTLSLIQNQITHYKIIAALTKVFKIAFHNVFWHVKEPSIFLHPSGSPWWRDERESPHYLEIYQNPPPRPESTPLSAKF